MVVRSVEFVGSVVSPGQELPSTLPQIAFAGRSNVGKSSLINRVLGRPRRGVARVSAVPGKTQALNFYEVNAGRSGSSRPARSATAGVAPASGRAAGAGAAEAASRRAAGAGPSAAGRVRGSPSPAFCLVDLPGSGYARAPRAARDSWRVLVRRYLAGGRRLCGVVYLVDSRHPATAGDLEFVDGLAKLGLPTLIALTKVDKLKPSVRAGGLAGRAAQRLQVDKDQIVESSARTGEGAEELRAALAALLAQVGRRPGSLAVSSHPDALPRTATRS